MAGLAASAIPLPRQLGLTWQVLQWCGAGLTADGHYGSSGQVTSQGKPD
jgi:hypothetical protein